MKTLILQFTTIFLAMASISDAQIRWADLSPEERSARIEAIREARRQRIRAERIATRQRARDAGRAEARASRVRDRAFLAVWTGLTSEVRGMYAARELAVRLSRRPVWKTQTRAERIAAATSFITNYPAIKAARQQKTMDEAMRTGAGAYPEPPAADALARVLNATPAEIPAFRQAGDPVELSASVQAPAIATFPDSEVPDLFTINRRFNWNKPHGQWMNQMLKDIDAAKAAGDTATYETLTKRYAAWADKYLRRDE